MQTDEYQMHHTGEYLPHHADEQLVAADVLGREGAGDGRDVDATTRSRPPHARVGGVALVV